MDKNPPDFQLEGLGFFVGFFPLYQFYNKNTQMYVLNPASQAV